MTSFFGSEVTKLTELAIASMKKNGILRTNFTKLQQEVGLKRSHTKYTYINKEHFIYACIGVYLRNIELQVNRIKTSSNTPLKKLTLFVDFLYLHCQDEYRFCPVYDAVKVYKRERLTYDDKYDMTNEEIKAYYGFQSEFIAYANDFERLIKDSVRDSVNLYVSEIKQKVTTSPTYAKPIAESIISEFKDKSKEQSREFFQVYECLNNLIDKYNDGTNTQAIRPPKNKRFSTLLNKANKSEITESTPTTITESTPTADTSSITPATPQPPLDETPTPQKELTQVEILHQKLAAYPLPPMLLQEQINSHRALSMEQVIQNNIERRTYGFKDLPVGDIQVRLDLKLWGKHTNLQLYFTEVETGNKYTIAVFKPFNLDEFDGYCDRDQNIDFSQPYLNGRLYNFNIRKTKNGYYNLMTASEIV